MTLVGFLFGLLGLACVHQPNAIFYASYATSINANWGDGTLTGTASGGAAVSGGYLQLNSGAQDYVDYNQDNLANMSHQGAARVTYKPGYSGAPGLSQIIFTTWNPSGHAAVALFHFAGAGGVLIGVMKDDAGSEHDILSTSVYSPTSGVADNIEYDWNPVSGAHTFWVNGTQLGSTVTDTYTATFNVGVHIRVGDQFGNSPGNTPNFAVQNFILFNAVQHTASFASQLPFSYCPN